MRVELRDACFAFAPDRPVFRNLNFNVGEGEILAVLGPNGTGKTTFLKTILGIFKLNQGVIFFNGTKMEDIKNKDLQTGYVPQSFSVTFAYSVLEMVTVGRAGSVGMFSAPSPRDLQIAGQALEMVGIGHLAKEDFLKLSGGQKQLVFIARALASEARLLLLDEPTSALDFKYQHHVLQLLRRLARTKKITVILTTHQPQQALQTADKVLFMNPRGESVFGRSSDVFTEFNLKKTYDMELRIISQQYRGACLKCVVPVGQSRDFAEREPAKSVGLP